MARIFGKGHAKNVANFDDLISFVEGYSESYNPSREAFKLQSLQLVTKNIKNVSMLSMLRYRPIAKQLLGRSKQSFIHLSHHSILKYVVIY